MVFNGVIIGSVIGAGPYFNGIDDAEFIMAFAAALGAVGFVCFDDDAGSFELAVEIDEFFVIVVFGFGNDPDVFRPEFFRGSDKSVDNGLAVDLVKVRADRFGSAVDEISEFDIDISGIGRVVEKYFDFIGRRGLH